MDALDRKYVLAVAGEKSFSKAAARLYISQPALSAYVIKLEKRLGCQLFDRSFTPLALTPAGAEYIACARKMEELEAGLGNFLSDLEHLEAGRLVVGGSQFFCSCFLPPVLTEFSRRYPKIQVALEENGYPQLQAMLMDGSVDGILDYAPKESSDHFTLLPLKVEEVFLAVPEDSPANKKWEDRRLSLEAVRRGDYRSGKVPGVPLGDFREEPFLFLNNEHNLYSLGQRLCRNAGFRPQVRLYLNQILTTYALSLAGYGCSFISDTVLQYGNFARSPAIYRIEDEEATRTLSVIYKKNRYVSRALRQFIQLAAEHLGGNQD